MEKNQKSLDKLILSIFWGYLLSAITLNFGWIPIIQTIASLGLLFYALRHLKDETKGFKVAYYLLHIKIIGDLLFIMLPYVLPFEIPMSMTLLFTSINSIMYICIFKGMTKYSDINFNMMLISALGLLGIIFAINSLYITHLWLVLFMALTFIVIILREIYKCYQDVSQKKLPIQLPTYKINPYISFYALAIVSIVISIIVMYAWPYFKYEYDDNIINWDSQNLIEQYQYTRESYSVNIDVYDYDEEKFKYSITYQKNNEDKYNYIDLRMQTSDERAYVGYIQVFDGDKKYYSQEIGFEEEYNGFFAINDRHKVLRTYLNPQSKDFTVRFEMFASKMGRNEEDNKEHPLFFECIPTIVGYEYGSFNQFDLPSYRNQDCFVFEGSKIIDEEMINIK